MKYFPLKTVIFCIVLVPLLFTGTLTCIEKYLERSYQQTIKEHIQEHINAQTNALLNGTITIYEALDKAFKIFKETDIRVKKFHIVPYIKITVKGGDVIYTSCNKLEHLDSNQFAHQIDCNLFAHQISDNNKKILNMGIDVQVDITIRQNTTIFNFILILYIFFALLVFGFFYKQALSKIKHDDMKRGETISNLVKDEQEYIDKLDTLKKEREILASKLTEVKAEYQKESKRASLAEEELFNDIDELEKKLQENISLQKEKEQEIEHLKTQLEKVERRKLSGKKRKSVDLIEKRFANLYKNIEMNQRAIDGLLDLDDEDMQLKAEEVIHQLNDEPLGVTVKRKVFTGKKNKTASFEVLFAYNGRLYFRNIEGNKIEILVIGTKNTQDKDMEFLHYI